MNPEQPSPVSTRWPVYGHRWAVAHLTLALAAGAAHGGGPRHAYLFQGPRQIGKSTFVRAYAQTLLCTGEVAPCGECRSCKLMERRSHPDFFRVAPLDKPPDDRAQGAKVPKVDRVGGTLYVDQARQVIHDVQLRPIEGRYKVFHIQDAQVANDSFFNALLKTLEEPPESTVICLTATDRNAILPTILSRCQVLELHPLDLETVAEALRTGWNVSADQAQLLTRLANGRLGWAVEQAQHADLWDERRQRLEQLWALLGADRVERLAASEALAARGASLYTTLELWVTWWRDLLLVQAGCAEACANVDQHDRLREQARGLEPNDVQRFVRTLQRVDGLLKETTVNVRLALDTLLLQMPSLSGP